MTEQSSIKQNPFNPIVILLVVAAFGIGFLYNKVQMLEKGVSVQQGQ
jgi:hypothetical protein